MAKALLCIFALIGANMALIGPCERHRETANDFIPKCTADGLYAPIQCHSGFCWCSATDGRPVFGTTVEVHLEPKCQRSAHRRELTDHKRFCSQNDRTLFNNNLLNVFKSELKRINNNEANDSARVANWKFSKLDLNDDGRLGKREMRQLKRMSAKMIEPRQCAKMFFSYCDSNTDGSIERNEWNVCLGVANDLSLRVFMSLHDRVTLFPLKTKDDNGNNEDEDDDDIDDETIKDCAHVRELALRANGSFVPECDARAFKEVQCLKSLCWCVNRRNGKTVKGSVSRGQKPDCVSAKQTAKAQKGCADKRKNRFTEIFLDTIKREYANQTAGHITTDTHAMRWKFTRMDINNNDILEQSEWKEWRRQLKRLSVPKLRKCARTFVRMCDSDGNRRLTFVEFERCLRRDTVLRKNPFEAILKAD